MELGEDPIMVVLAAIITVLGGVALGLSLWWARDKKRPADAAEGPASEAPASVSSDRTERSAIEESSSRASSPTRRRRARVRHVAAGA